MDLNIELLWQIYDVAFVLFIIYPLGLYNNSSALKGSTGECEVVVMILICLFIMIIS